MSQKAHTFTRRELYELVWTTPIQKLAEKFGMSDRGLAKLCARHKVPTPPRGYWARVAAGQKPKRPLHREIDNPRLDHIVIEPTLGRLSDETLQLVDAAKKERVARRQSAAASSGSPQFDTPVEKPHRALAATARALRKAKPDADGVVAASGEGKCGVIVHVDRIERAIGFLEALATTLESEGVTLSPGGGRLLLSIGPDMVPITLTERTRRREHVPTDQELAEYERIKERRRRRRDAFDIEFIYGRAEPWPEYDRVATGQLVLAADIWADGMRKSWGDGKTQTLESMFVDIVAGLRLLLAYEKQRREEREDAEQQRQEIARRRELAKKRHEREERRLEFLNGLIDAQVEAERIRTWLKSLPADAADASPEFARMLVWAKARADTLEGRLKADALAEQLAGSELFPETDELHDPLGDPPAPRYPW